VVVYDEQQTNRVAGLFANLIILRFSVLRVTLAVSKTWSMSDTGFIDSCPNPLL
jgi:hypothetical protein